MAREKKKEPLIWEEPPPRPQRYDWSSIAADLRARPMEWAKVFDKDRSSVVVAIRQGSLITVHPALGFECRTAHNNKHARPRTCTLYMRFNPDKAEAGVTEAILQERRATSATSRHD